MTETKRLYVGVGISTYSDPAFPELPKAVEDVKELGTYLQQHHGYYCFEPILNPTEDTARTKLKRQLKKNALPPGSALVLLWAGHGEKAPEGLRLIASDSQKRDAPDLTPQTLASHVARSGASQALLLLDTCYSGMGVFDAQHVVDQVRSEVADKRHWLGVLAATRNFERARDGVFIERVLHLLQEGPTDPELQRRWSAHNAGVRGDDIMEVLVNEWNLTSQCPKTATSGIGWPMFPNPRFDRDAPECIVEHLLLAAEGRAPNEEGVYFTGRTAPLNALVQWMQTGKPGVFVLTGPAGSGKSAIAGRLAILSNPTQRARLCAVGPLDSADPGEGSVDAHIHARRLTVSQVVETIDQQLVRHAVLPALPGGAARNRGELLGGLERLDRCPFIVLDGLDEAGEEAWAIAQKVIGLLAESVRVLIATRRLPSRKPGTPDLIQTLAPQHLIDLGDLDLAQPTQQDVTAYVRKRLAGYNQSMDASKVAEAILRRSDQAQEGAFLLAQVITSQLRAAPIDTSMPGWEEALSRSIEDAFDRDLARVDDPIGARELLTALAWAYGSGLSDDLWPLVATALSSTGRHFDREAAYSVLGSAGRYIVEDGEGGRAVYRLSHQRLVERLHPPAKPRELDAYQEQAAHVARALVTHYRDFLATGLQPKDHPYLWRYTWRHCADAGPQGIAALRELVAVDSVAFRPVLARALNNLSIRYREVGRSKYALGPTEEAVEIYHTLAQDSPVFRPDLAGTLDNLGLCCRELGHHRRALALAEKAVATYRPLAQDNPVFQFDLAMALNNLGIHYRELCDREKATAYTEEAVGLFRTLAQDNSAFRPDLAGALNNLSACYSDVRRCHEALALIEEAVTTYRILAQNNSAFWPDLAMALSNLGPCYRDVDRCKDALAPTKESVEIYHTLAQDNPVFRSDLAGALYNLSLCYHDVGRRQDVFALIEGAITIYRTLAQDSPAFLPELNKALEIFNMYRHVYHHQDVLEEDIATYRTLVQATPTFLPGLASALGNLGNHYCKAGRHEDALIPTQEASVIYRALAQDNIAFLPSLAFALGNLGNSYSKIGRHQDALAPTEEAVATYRILAQSNPAFLSDLAMSLYNLGIFYSEVGRRQDAIAFTEEAVRLRRALAQNNPAFLPDLASTLGILSNHYRKVGRYQHALASTEEAVATYRALAQGNPVFLRDLAGALNNLGIHYREVGREAEIDVSWEQVFSILPAEACETLQGLRTDTTMGCSKQGTA